jgi:type IX secretion system PorP/SprF family membrane protein
MKMKNIDSPKQIQLPRRILRLGVGLLILMLIPKENLFAQTEPMYAQYMYNMLGLNPAYAGNREAIGLNFFQRRQWAGLQGAPQTTSVSLDGIAKGNKLGWGVQVYDDKLRQLKYVFLKRELYLVVYHLVL